MVDFADLDNLYNEFLVSVAEVDSVHDLYQLKSSYIGKSGFVTKLLSRMKDLSSDERKVVGKSINNVRGKIEEKILAVRGEIEKARLDEEIAAGRIDISLPEHSDNIVCGKKNIITHTIEQLKLIMNLLGFLHVDGPEIEDDWHNFTALNIPEDHPARQMHDTFYISNDGDGDSDSNGDSNGDSGGDGGGGARLLRTHTSSVQMRYLASHKPPVAIFSCGKVYRADYDATHLPMFHQIEGLCIRSGATIAYLKGLLQQLLRLFFEIPDVPMRFRSNYFPFTSPSMEVDILCNKKMMKQHNRLEIGKGDDWLEILGCGMVHHNVLKNMGLDPNEHQGFAFGIGIERLAMLKYGIADIRLLYNNDIRYVQHYGV